MFFSRGLVSILAFMSLWAAPMQAAQAAGESGGSSSTINFRLHNTTVPWGFITPGGMTNSCPDIPAGVVINPDDKGSNRDQQATVEVKPDGSKHIVLVDTVVGTAHDNSKVPYRFNYYNKGTIDFDGKIAKVRMQDSFRMKGGKVNMNVVFEWEWAYAATAITVSLTAQNILVDPWPFAVSKWPVATIEELKEDPNIVPGSLKKISMVGMPYACDPL